MSEDFDFSDAVRGLQVPTMIVTADADMTPPSHAVEIFSLLDGGQRDGGWMGEGRPKGGHALAVIPGATHYDVLSSPVLQVAVLTFLESQSAPAQAAACVSRNPHPKEIPMALTFNSILIGSEDPDRLVAYYTRLFGEPAMADGGYTSWQFGTGYVSIGAHDEVRGQNAHPGRVIWNLETPDVQTEFDRLKAADAIVVREPYSFPEYPDMFIATLADPDDNLFQLMTPMGPDTTG